MEDEVRCAKCRRDKPRADFWPKTLAKRPPHYCRECIAGFVEESRKNKCGCSDCRWFAKNRPQERWRRQAAELTGSGLNRPLLEIASELATGAYGDAAPTCNGKAWAYLALKYDARLM